MGSMRRWQQPKISTSLVPVLSHINELKVAGRLLYTRSLALGNKDDSEEIGYLAERVAAHARAVETALKETQTKDQVPPSAR